MFADTFYPVQAASEIALALLDTFSLLMPSKKGANMSSARSFMSSYKS